MMTDVIKENQAWNLYPKFNFSIPCLVYPEIKLLKIYIQIG